MTRIALIALSALLPILAPAAALWAQPPAKLHRIGLLIPGSSQAAPSPSIKALLRTAKALGRTMPQSVLIRADEVIQ